MRPHISEGIVLLSAYVDCCLASCCDDLTIRSDREAVHWPITVDVVGLANHLPRRIPDFDSPILSGSRQQYLISAFGLKELQRCCASTMAMLPKLGITRSHALSEIRKNKITYRLSTCRFVPASLWTVDDHARACAEASALIANQSCHRKREQEIQASSPCFRNRPWMLAPSRVTYSCRRVARSMYFKFSVNLTSAAC